MLTRVCQDLLVHILQCLTAHHKLAAISRLSRLPSAACTRLPARLYCGYTARLRCRVGYSTTRTAQTGQVSRLETNFPVAEIVGCRDHGKAAPTDGLDRSRAAQHCLVSSPDRVGCVAVAASLRRVCSWLLESLVLDNCRLVDGDESLTGAEQQSACTLKVLGYSLLSAPRSEFHCFAGAAVAEAARLRGSSLPALRQALHLSLFVTADGGARPPNLTEFAFLPFPINLADRWNPELEQSFAAASRQLGVRVLYAAGSTRHHRPQRVQLQPLAASAD
jgi:hypothetical protein